MKKFGIATIAAAGFAAAIVGLAAPAQAAIVAAPAGLASVEFKTDLDHQLWVNDLQPKVQVPPVAIFGNGR